MAKDLAKELKEMAIALIKSRALRKEIEAEMIDAAMSTAPQEIREQVELEPKLSRQAYLAAKYWGCSNPDFAYKAKKTFTGELEYLNPSYPGLNSTSIGNA